MRREDIVKNIFRKKSFLCVGLDPDPAKMPQSLVEQGEEGLKKFLTDIVDATAPYCIAYKLNIAFYEAMGLAGLKVFYEISRYIRLTYPDQFIIADAKRGDIGNTARMYASSFFESADFDATTVAPYMGADSVTPFLSFKDRWAIVLALTSNEGSRDFQMLRCDDGMRLFEHVIRKATKWGTPRNLMFVVGATRGELIAEARRAAPDSFFLVPGVGAQGGSLEEVCRLGLIDDVGLIVNSSRGIIHASSDDDFARVAANRASEMRVEMMSILQKFHKI